MTAGHRVLARVSGTLGLALALLAGAAGPALACPSCKAALDSSDRWQTAFNASVLFMMSMPFAVAAVVAGAVYRAHRRKRAAEHAAGPPPAG
jgi:hypothetical protein